MLPPGEEGQGAGALAAPRACLAGDLPQQAVPGKGGRDQSTGSVSKPQPCSSSCHHYLQSVNSFSAFRKAPKTPQAPGARGPSPMPFQDEPLLEGGSLEAAVPGREVHTEDRSSGCLSAGPAPPPALGSYLLSLTPHPEPLDFCFLCSFWLCSRLCLVGWILLPQPAPGEHA